MFKNINIDITKDEVRVEYYNNTGIPSPPPLKKTCFKLSKSPTISDEEFIRDVKTILREQLDKMIDGTFTIDQ